MTKPLKICVDATSVRGNLSGVGFCTLSLIQALQILQETENYQLQVFFQPGMKNWLQQKFIPSPHLQNIDNPYCLPLPVTLTNFLMRFPNPILPALDSGLGQPDIVHGTDHFVFPSRHSRNIMTILDLTFIKYPQYVSKIVTTYRDRIERCLKYTDAVITISENSKKDILQYFPLDPDKVYAVPLASRYSSNPLDDCQIDKLKSQTDYDFSKPYFLFVSTLEPRKNVITLIKAFNQLKKVHKLEHQLVLIGQLGWKYEAILAAIQDSPYASEIYHLNYLSDQLLILFYTLAEAFVYPSFYEGFGLPVLEAMTLGCPVITSNQSSLPEVTGDTGLLIDPNNPLELTEAMLKVTSDRSFRQDMITRGTVQAAKFSWEKTAKETLKVYRSVSNNSALK